MTKDEALKLALEALERCVATCFEPYAHEQAMSWSEHFVNQTITAINEVLAQLEPWEKFCDSNCVWTDHHPDCNLAEQKQKTECVTYAGNGTAEFLEGERPTGFFIQADKRQPEQHQDWCASLTKMLTSIPPKRAPCNCTPPQREWVGLRWSDVPDQWCGNVAFIEGGKWAEKVLKEKNYD